MFCYHEIFLRPNVLILVSVPQLDTALSVLLTQTDQVRAERENNVGLGRQLTEIMEDVKFKAAAVKQDIEKLGKHNKELRAKMFQ